MDEILLNLIHPSPVGSQPGLFSELERSVDVFSDKALGLIFACVDVPLELKRGVALLRLQPVRLMTDGQDELATWVAAI